MKILTFAMLILSGSILQADGEYETPQCRLQKVPNFDKQFPFPYCELKDLMPFSGHGWYMNAAPMEKLLKERKVKVVIELGSWLGKSTKHIAEILPEDGIVYAVDHWLGNPASRVNNPELIPTLYEQFLSNMIHANLTHKVVPLKMTTQEAVQYFYDNGIVPDLIYVDASHEEVDAYRDIAAYFPMVKGHGIICGDDWSYGDLPVQRAVKRFAKENDLKIEVPNDWFWELHQKAEDSE